MENFFRGFKDFQNKKNPFKNVYNYGERTRKNNIKNPMLLTVIFTVMFVFLRRIAFSLRLFAIGMAQKMLIANSVAPVADKVFALPESALDASIAWLGTLVYTL